MNRLVTIIVALCLLLSALPAMAATPDAGTILREFQEPPPAKIPEKKPVEQPKVIPSAEGETGMKIKVISFDFDGLSLFSALELQEELADLVGKELTMSQLEVAPQRIVAYYSKRGRIATALLPRQEIKDGRVLIKIIEGKLGQVTVDPNFKSRMRPDLALRYLLRENRIGESINKDALETAVRLLKGLPGVSASTTLLPGKEQGMSDLVLQLADAPLLSGNVELDNHGSFSSGEYRGALALNLNDPFGYGDQVSLRGQTSIKNNYGRLAYNIPVGAAGARLSLSSSYLHYDLGGELQSKGDAVTAGEIFSFPILRSPVFNLSGQFGYDFRWLYNEAKGLAVNNKLMHTGNIGVNVDLSDRLMGGGFNSLSIGFGGGNVDLSATPSDEALDVAGPKRAGLFGKFTFNVSRTQTIKENSTSLSLSVNGQYALNNLDSSEQFGLGGVYGVRAYPASEASGDTGFVFSAEFRQALMEKLQAALFYDLGWIRKNTDSWTGSEVHNEYALDGAGFGLTWTPASWWTVKGIVATRIQNNSGADSKGKDSDGTKRQPRFWIQTLIDF